MANTTVTPTNGALLATGALNPMSEGFYLSAITQPGNFFRTEGIFNEQLIHRGRCRVWGIYPEPNTTAGTITLRDAGNTVKQQGTTARHICAAALPQAGKSFGAKGLDFQDGLTVQLSNVADLTAICWEAR